MYMEESSLHLGGAADLYIAQGSDRKSLDSIPFFPLAASFLAALNSVSRTNSDYEAAGSADAVLLQENRACQQKS